MPGHRIGYIRVSSLNQNPERQLEAVPVDRIFTDKASGKDVQRPQLDQLLTFVREGTRWSYTVWTGWLATWMNCAGSCRI